MRKTPAAAAAGGAADGEEKEDEGAEDAVAGDEFWLFSLDVIDMAGFTGAWRDSGVVAWRACRPVSLPVSLPVALPVSLPVALPVALPVCLWVVAARWLTTVALCRYRHPPGLLDETMRLSVLLKSRCSK
jgi:hypothetical protein